MHKAFTSLVKYRFVSPPKAGKQIHENLEACVVCLVGDINTGFGF